MIFFDIDDTLLDHQGAERRGAAQFYHQYRHELPYGKADFLQAWEEASEHFYTKYLTGCLSLQEQRRERIRSFFPELLDVEADERFQDYLDYYEVNWRRFDDVKACLDRWTKAGLSLGVISNGSQQQQQSKLERLEIREFFRYVVTSEAAGVAKPDPHIFAYACNLAKEAVESCFYVGDRLKTDAVASQQAGLTGVWLNRLGKELRETDVIIIRSLDELDKYLTI
ncbi:HAD family hydrolase [Halalkalibacterium halodurans]|uniref:BH0473 protein n=1 Tax=Halalkalibacterium halodurans (strain ATCC BAA-125 / DSM 18197 / FERM 7344 / JCM 9153 / C-125) TaxID=272558 RepID=Q9KFK6_HALH5|nr:HAD family hydrolase [Halalkalibacterium halodurans]MDY7220971.1 HAD family hydrolase [Halalkalibacterium halodurans]MDY7240210.1 HAD family hydrolase [Halalkalibacterium halodurans]MED4079862.1 HAD family hydrolase [Halalkalibacterium halodurans]MED4085319.1 HAD family hydrolase [Halalkalibacterium halodurans]MED4103852.1 HAD family hydrolase [Halalkalibacterium halodurans]